MKKNISQNTHVAPPTCTTAPEQTSTTRLALKSTAEPHTPATPPPPQAPSTNLTTSEAAHYLHVQPATLEQWRWNGRGPNYVKIGRSCRYRQVDLESFLEARVFGSTTEAQAGA